MKNKKDIYKSEAGHWYDHEGKPMYTIVGVNGKERNTTLRDAKKEGFVPSVTTIIGIAAKPSLENWKITQALEASLTVDQNDLEYINKCKYAGREVGMKAAKQGTKIHAMIEKAIEVPFKHVLCFGQRTELKPADPTSPVVEERGEAAPRH